MLLSDIKLKCHDCENVETAEYTKTLFGPRLNAELQSCLNFERKETEKAKSKENEQRIGETWTV